MKPNIRVLTAAAVTLFAACGDPVETVHQTEDGLLARVSYTGLADQRITPFTAAYLERGQFWARTVGNSDAFRQCVQNTMTAQYMNVNDPNPTASRTTQIAGAWSNFRNSYNNVEYRLRPQSEFPGAGASAGYGDPNDYLSERTTTVYSHYRADFGDWQNGRTYSYGAVRYRPWNWRADDLIHEYMHWQGYRHADSGTCTNEAGTGPATCAGNCSWLLSCAGSGTPPSWMTYDNAGRAQENFVAVKNGRGEHTYRTMGEVSAPYIYGRCASAVIVASDAACGDATLNCPRDDQLRLMTSWSGVNTTAQSTTTSCGCVADPRHEISLRGPTGYNVTAYGGGGAALKTRWSTGWGSWQILYAVETGATPDAWYSGEEVVLKTYDGHFVDPSFTGAGATPNALNVYKTSFSGRIEDGSTVYVWDAGWANDNGNELTNGGGVTAFTVVEPKRHLVYLSTYHGRYVTREGGLLYNRATDADLDYGTQQDLQGDELNDPSVAFQRTAAFWVIDWNGGDIADGDQISLQPLDDDSNGNHQYVHASGTGHVGLANGVIGAGRFVVDVLGGASVSHGSTVSLRSSGGTYLTAMPDDYFDAQIRNYGPSVGTWQRFGIEFVHSHDWDRRAKW